MERTVTTPDRCGFACPDGLRLACDREPGHAEPHGARPPRSPWPGDPPELRGAVCLRCGGALSGAPLEAHDPAACAAELLWREGCARGLAVAWSSELDELREAGVPIEHHPTAWSPAYGARLEPYAPGWALAVVTHDETASDRPTRVAVLRRLAADPTAAAMVAAHPESARALVEDEMRKART